MSSNIDQIFKFFYFKIRRKFVKNIITKYPTTLQVCRCITL